MKYDNDRSLEPPTRVDGVDDQHVNQRVGSVRSGLQHESCEKIEGAYLLNPVRLLCRVMMSVPVSSRSITTAAPNAADVIHLKRFRQFSSLENALVQPRYLIRTATLSKSAKVGRMKLEQGQGIDISAYSQILWAMNLRLNGSG